MLTDDHRKTQVLSLKEQMLDAAVRYARDGKELTLKERLRVASDLSGLSAETIELEMKR